MNPERYPMHFDPVPCDPEAAIATLSTRTLAELCYKLPQYEIVHEARADNPWLDVITNERSRRIQATRRLSTLEAYRPSQAESPEYDAEAGPMAYLELARDTNLEAEMATEKIGKGMPEKDLVNALMHSYIQSKLPEDAADDSRNLINPELLDFFAANARGLLLGPLSAATLSYRDEKNALVRSYVARPGTTKLSYQLHILNKPQLEGLRIEVENLPYRASVPDFYQQRRAYQDDILEAIVSECVELCGLVEDVDLGDYLRMGTTTERMPLAYHSVAELRQAIQQSPLPPSEVCKIFLVQPQKFWKVLTNTNEVTVRKRRIEIETKQRLEALKAQPKPSNEANHNKVRQENPENIDIVQRLLDDPEVNETVLDAEQGSPVAITELDRLISGSKFDKLLDKHIELIGRALWENMGDQSSRGLQLDNWDKFNVGGSLRGKFEGNLRNLKITQLPVNEEELKKTLHRSYSPDMLPAKNALRLLIEAEMKPTGKPAEPVHLTMLMMIQKTRSYAKPRDLLRKSKQSARTTGPAAALRLATEAQIMSRAVEGEALARPLRIGLPGLGKRR